ncbi:MAG: type 2 isopentenyl-diphosphate Delta-isomerase, partial [Halobacteriales archaeon]|nr:type 2 isopentenyl-diphosphate Delta-isomerase [Halobacteriales archaeon]
GVVKAAPKRVPAKKAAKGAMREPTTAEKALETERRKEEHLRIPLERDVQSIPSPWDALRFRHNALPELDRSEVRLDTTFLGRRLRAPLQVTGMTGGARKAKEFNGRLAAAAAEHGLAMGVGSQRAALENPALADTYRVILDHDVPLRMANLGLPQLILWGEGAVAKAEQAVEMVEAHALCVHLNYLQEAVQPEGDTVARGGLDALHRLCAELEVPVVVKETGAGLTGATAAALERIGISALDVGGLGGTSFSAVEHHRAVDQGDHAKARLGRTFWDWGIPTPQALREARQACPSLPLVATGGLRSGLDALRALCLGADLAGFAGHLFRAAAAGPDGASQEAALVLEELKTGLFLLGLPDPSSVTEDHLA